MPSERMVVPRSEALAPPEALAVPISGGQAAAQAASQCDVPPLSASNRYTVIFLLPAARIVPSFLSCLVVSTTGLAVAAALELVLDDVLAAVVDDVLGAAALFVLLLLLPHPATTM